MRAHLFFHCILLTAWLPPAIHAQTTIDATACHAYAGNAGWINTRPGTAQGLTLSEFTLDGWAYAANVGWISFGDGSPADGVRYRNDTATDCGVNQDGAGNLSGYAYGANIGWINFGWASSTHPQRPRVNLSTGQFDGYAYGGNVGWIHLGSGLLKSVRIAVVDLDGDGMSDAWEKLNFGNTTKAGITTNADRDSQSDVQEYLAGTNPNKAQELFQVLQQSLDPATGRMTISFRSDRSRLYRIEHSTSLTGQWIDSPLGLISPDTGSTTTRTLTFPPGDRRFFRVVTVRPLTP